MSQLLLPRRPFREVTLPGGDTVYVRDVSIRDLDEVDAAAEAIPAGPERGVRSALELCHRALCDGNGAPTFPGVDDLRGLTPSQLEAIADAAIPSKDAAKKN